MKNVWAAAAMAVTMAGGAIYAQGPGQPWTSIGATGIVDEADTDKIQTYDTGSIALRSSINVGTATVRYNVTATSGLALRSATDPDEPALDLNASIRDTGPTARVIVRLQQMNRATGTITTIATIDSDTFDYEASPNYVPRGARVLANGQSTRQLDFYTNVYFVDVQLSKTAASGNPGVKFVAIEKTE